MARINAGSTLANQYAPPFVVADNVATGWELQWNATIEAFEAYDPSGNVVETGFDSIDVAFFEGVTQQVFVVPWETETKQSLIITIQGVKQQQTAYTYMSASASGVTTITLAETVVNEDVEILGLQTSGGASTEIYGPIAADLNSPGVAQSDFALSWLAPSVQSLIVTVDGVKQATNTYSIIPNATATATTLRFLNPTSTFLTSAAGIDAGTEIITTIGTHGLLTGDGVTYSTEGGVETVGLTNNGTYFANVKTSTTLSLHISRTDALGDASRIDLTVSGAETHALVRVTTPIISVGAAIIDDGGTGYDVGDIIELTGGTFTTPAQFRVATEAANVITSIDIISAGEYSVFPSTPNAPTTAILPGTGTGAEFTLIKDSQQVEVVGILTAGETPASPVNVVSTYGLDDPIADVFSTYRDKTLSGDEQILNFKAIEGGSNVTITDNANRLTIAAVEAVFTANIGSGTDIAVVDIGADPTTVGFRGMLGGDRIALSVASDTITVDYAIGYQNVIHATDADPYVQLATDRLIGITALVATQGVTLLDPSTVPTGDTVTVKNQTDDTSTITLTPAAGLIDGQATYAFGTARGYVTLYSDGINYHIIATG